MKIENNITRTILEHLAESGKLMLEAFLPVLNPYPRFLPNTYPRRQNHPLPKNKNRKQTISSILWRLKKEKLVTSTGKKRKTTWSITSKGKGYLKERARETIRIRHEVEILPPEDKVSRLLIFDIPEKERRKREWLRQGLIARGFTMLQRSVFLGTRPLSTEFIEDCDELGLHKYIHLIRIDKPGTLDKK